MDILSALLLSGQVSQAWVVLTSVGSRVLESQEPTHPCGCKPSDQCQVPLYVHGVLNSLQQRSALRWAALEQDDKSSLTETT